MLRFIILVSAAFGLSSSALAGNSATKTSPVFGGGNVTPMTTVEMGQTTAKGYASYTYGRDGWNFAYDSFAQGYYGVWYYNDINSVALQFAQARDQASNASYWLYYAARN